MSKPITVETNDSESSRKVLKLSGDVIPYVTVDPYRVMLSGRADEPIAETVKIIPQTDEPLTIEEVTAVRGLDFTYTLEEIELEGKKAYGLRLQNTRTKPGRYYDKIRLKTDSDIIQTISIVVTGVIGPAERAQE